MKPKTVKIGRRYRPYGYEIGLHKSKFQKDSGFTALGYIKGFCSKSFESITGFKLKPGESCLVQFHVKRVKK